MAFLRDLCAAANRHLDAATLLDAGPHRGVAGYLFGIAAECAVKRLMPVAGIRNNDAFYKHFPELRTILRDVMERRSAKTLARFINDDAFMNNWDVTMRYAAAREVRPEWVARWASQARDVVGVMNAEV
jgi:hypothetical protein